MSANNKSAPEPGPLVTAIEFVARVLVWFTAAILLVLCVLTLVELIARYGFRSPLYGYIDVVEILLPVFLLGGALSLAAGWDAGRMGPLWAIPRMGFLLLVALPVIAMLIYSAISGLSLSWSFDERSYGMLALPLWPRDLIVILAAAALGVQVLAEVGRCLICLESRQWPTRGGPGWSAQSLIGRAKLAERRKQALDDIWN